MSSSVGRQGYFCLAFFSETYNVESHGALSAMGGRQDLMALEMKCLSNFNVTVGETLSGGGGVCVCVYSISLLPLSRSLSLSLSLSCSLSFSHSSQQGAVLTILLIFSLPWRDGGHQREPERRNNKVCLTVSNSYDT